MVSNYGLFVQKCTKYDRCRVNSSIGKVAINLDRLNQSIKYAKLKLDYLAISIGADDHTNKVQLLHFVLETIKNSSLTWVLQTIRVAVSILLFTRWWSRNEYVRLLSLEYLLEIGFQDSKHCTESVIVRIENLKVLKSVQFICFESQGIKCQKNHGVCQRIWLLGYKTDMVGNRSRFDKAKSCIDLYEREFDFFNASTNWYQSTNKRLG